MSEIKLLPCPFCGGTKLKIDKKSSLVGYNGIDERVERWTFSVRCNSCHARGGAVGGKVIPFKYADVERKDIVTKEELQKKSMEAWNTRKPMDNIEKQLENASYWTDSTFDEDGYCNDDSNEVVDLHRAIDIIRAGGKE